MVRFHSLSLPSNSLHTFLVIRNREGLEEGDLGVVKFEMIEDIIVRCSRVEKLAERIVQLFGIVFHSLFGVVDDVEGLSRQGNGAGLLGQV